MYPDHDDVKRGIGVLKLGQHLKAEDIWEDVVLMYNLLHELKVGCWRDGKHTFGLVTDLKTVAESYIGRVVSMDAFRVAMLENDLEVKISKTDGSLIVKFPPTAGFEEVRERWKEYQAGHQQEIELEKERLIQQAKQFGWPVPSFTKS